jgi:hypothetical protein
MFPYPGNMKDMQIVGLLNQHRAAIIALEAIVAAIPKTAEIDREVVKQKIRDSKVFGTIAPEFVSVCEETALKILG